MADEYKCGSIANIINSQSDELKSKKKKRKINNLFDEVVEENKDKVVELFKASDNKKFKKENDSNNEDSEEDEDDKESDESEDEKILLRRKKKKEPKEKKNRTIFVGNLPTSITKKTLKKIFKKYGSIETIRLRGAAPQKLNIPKKAAVIKKLFSEAKDSLISYIVFKNENDASKALEMNSVEIEGHHIRVDLADNQQHDYSHSIFVGNLSFTTNDEELRYFFESCGDINSVRIIRDKKTGIGKGFGFVTFKSIDSVMLALERNDDEFKGRKIRITKAIPMKSNNDSKSSNFARQNKTPNVKQKKKLRKSEVNAEKNYKGKTVKKNQELKAKKNKKKKLKEKQIKRKKNDIAQILAV